MRAMTIGELAKQAGVGVETVRYYQRRGLLPVPPKGRGYRRYPVEVLDSLRFIRRAKGLGFSLREIGELLVLRRKPRRCEGLRSTLERKIAEVDARMRMLAAVRGSLGDALDRCRAHEGDAACDALERLLATAPSEAVLGPSIERELSGDADDEEERAGKRSSGE